MTTTQIEHPIVSQAEWLAARMELLAREKEFPRQRDALSAERELGWPKRLLHYSAQVLTKSDKFGSTSTAACSRTISNRLRVRAHSVPNNTATGESTPMVKAITRMGSVE